MEQFLRTEILLGSENLEKLKTKHIAIFGLGGVGSYVLETLARSGIGQFTLVDGDTFDITNINRQILATFSTIDKAKTKVAKQRVLEINPSAKINDFNVFYKGNMPQLHLENCDFVVDAIDMMSAKIQLIKECYEKNIPIISSASTGNKIDPTLFKTSDIFNTSVCPMCRILRRELKKIQINELKVVYSTEKPIAQTQKILSNKQRPIPGSVAFVPSVAGILIAKEIILDLINRSLKYRN